MARDNEGNWSYVYTADKNNVDKAQQNYEDKLYEYQKLNTDFIKNQQKNILDLEKPSVEKKNDFFRLLVRGIAVLLEDVLR